MQILEKSLTTDYPTETDVLTSQPSLGNLGTLLDTPGYQLTTNSMISNASPLSSTLITQEPKSSKTSGRGSASKEKVFKPYWNEHYKDKASQLLSPTVIDSLVSASISFKDSLSGREGLSWTSIRSVPLQWKNLPETLLPSVSPLGTGGPKYEVTRARRLLLKPSAEQKKLFRRLMGAYRYAYNKIIDYKAQEYEERGTTMLYMAGRKIWKARLVEEAPWIVEIPAHTIYGAMRAADRDYMQVIRQRKQGVHNNLPRCKRKTHRSCFILGNGITETGIYPKFIGPLCSAEPLPRHPMDSNLIHDIDGRWYLSTPYSTPVQHTETQGICALDPGVRTFITGISSTSCFKIGSGAFGQIVRLCHRLDDLVSKASKEKKRSFKRAIGRARVRIRNLIDDLHYQVIGYLTRTYQTIVFPEANFRSAVHKATRKIRTKTARAIMSFAFARFRDRLKAKAEVNGNTVLIVDESYTSKTANWTGEIVQNLGGAKAITSRGVSLDRDLNAALGILLKALPDRPFAGLPATALKHYLAADSKGK